jgi:hypothetical protein
MTRRRDIPISIARHLRLSADRFAAAAAVQSPGLMLELQVAESDDEEPSDPPQSPRRTVPLAPLPAVAALAPAR